VSVLYGQAPRGVRAAARLCLALVELPGLDNGHQVIRMLQHGDVGQRIALDRTPGWTALRIAAGV
jgi:hypothetical protein